MRLRHIPGSEEEIENSTWVYHSPEETQKNISSPLYLEIGMGKGRFIMENAFTYPDISFIGIEMYESVMVKATRKLDSLPDDEKPLNLHLIRMDARDTCDFFPKESIDRIYLNFPDPWPKARHAGRRLTSSGFLKRYDSILKKDGRIELKTDNLDLFEFSLEEARASGYEISYVTYDLHADEEAMKSNIMTGYEQKFSSLGNKICRYVIRRSLTSV